MCTSFGRPLTLVTLCIAIGIQDLGCLDPVVFSNHSYVGL